MHNPVLATRTVIVPGDPSLTSLGAPGPDAKFPPLSTCQVELAVTTVFDEVGRPLVGVFVPDGELL
jgi:hypothetical protein